MSWPANPTGHVALAFGLILAVVSPVAPAQELSAKEIFRKASQSIVLIKVYDHEGKPLVQGSGVVVANGVVASNCHVLSQKGSDYAAIEWRSSKIVVNGENLRGQDSERDLCTLDTPGLAAPAVTTIHSRDVGIGDKVYAIGAPEGLKLTLSEGLISGIREVQGLRLIQTTAPISHGSSGGGLFDTQGRLVGITTMMDTAGQALNFAIPAEWIAELPQQALNQRAVVPGGRQVIADTAVEAVDAAAAQASADAAAAAADAAVNSRWMYVDTNSDGEVVFLDRKTVKKSGSDVSAWWKTESEAPQKDKAGDTYDEILQLATFHCLIRQISPLSFVQRLRGKVIYSRDRKSYEVERENVQPDTIGEALFETVCGL